MKRLSDKFKELSIETKSPALMTHVVLGYPSLDESIDIVLAMAESGASIIELQIPFSDPMADGPTIMRANEHALSAGVTPAQCMEAAKKIRSKCEVPLLFMSYFNILLNYNSSKETKGVEGFCQDAKDAGIDGLIVPDVPPEEDVDGYWSYSKANDLFAVPLVSPVTTQKRFDKIKERIVEGGFIYCVSTTGTTGARNDLPKDLSEYLKKVRDEFKSPLAVGFGISSREQVNSLAGHAEMAIVGSAMINTITKAEENNKIQRVKDFTHQLLGR